MNTQICNLCFGLWSCRTTTMICFLTLDITLDLHPEPQTMNTHTPDIAESMVSGANAPDGGMTGVEITPGKSTSFKEMIRTANKAITSPDHNGLKDILHSKKLEISEKIKVMIKGKYFFFDHRSLDSLANENYGLSHSISSKTLSSRHSS